MSRSGIRLKAAGVDLAINEVAGRRPALCASYCRNWCTVWVWAHVSVHPSFHAGKGWDNTVLKVHVCFVLIWELRFVAVINLIQPFPASSRQHPFHERSIQKHHLWRDCVCQDVCLRSPPFLTSNE